ncbi:HAD-IA family hydrolase [Paracoccaceae bacterium]|nr:HAD-IA family hydrolase [Paracoccaceae bacterium]
MRHKTNEKLLLFDYDGTLVDSAQMIIEGTAKAFNRCGLTAPKPEEIKDGIGQKLDIAIKSYLPLKHKGTLDEVIRHYRQWYVEKDLEGKQFEPLFENIKPVLEKLYQDGWQLGIATNKSLRGLKRGLRHHGIEKFFSIIMTTDNFIPKPNKAMAMHALKTLKVKNSDAFVIGDTVYDIKMGKNAKINTIGAAWGYNTKEELKRADADHIINDPRELVKIMREL